MEDNSLKKIKEKKGIGFMFAWNGFLHLFKTQMNSRIHASIALLVIIAGLLLDLSGFEWIAVFLCIGLVFSAEMLNTAVEYLTDMVSPGFNETAGLVKDLAAGAVLVSAIASAAAGLWIFLPRLYAIFCIWSGNC